MRRHVTIGIVLLAVMAFPRVRRRFQPAILHTHRAERLVLALFVDLVWIFLFPL